MSADPSVERDESCEGPLVFIHIGDLHITEWPPEKSDARTRRERETRDMLKAILSEIERLSDSVDFVYLPGDLAENAGSTEYDILLGILQASPKLKIRLIPGDHDFAQGSIDHFETFRGSLKGRQAHEAPRSATVEGRLTGSPPRSGTVELKQFFFSEEIKGVKCIFLDLVTAGHGYKGVGLDFRIGKALTATCKVPTTNQWGWLVHEVRAAKKHGMPCAIFMHAYPHDLADGDEREDVAGLFWNQGVELVEMGHTHYNELAFDGRTVYATARSVGQNEDGPAGYAVVAIDDGVVSWRFRQIQQTLPFVLITSPADRRLAAVPLDTSCGRIEVRALVFWDEGQTGTVCCRVDDGPWRPMKGTAGSSLYERDVDWPDGSQRISVRAMDTKRVFSDDGNLVDLDTIEPALTTAGGFEAKTMPEVPGSDAVAIGPWPVKGVRGDQLGPNKKGHKW